MWTVRLPGPTRLRQTPLRSIPRHDVGDQYWSALVAEVDDMIWQAVQSGFGYFQREAGCGATYDVACDQQTRRGAAPA